MALQNKQWYVDNYPDKNSAVGAYINAGGYYKFKLGNGN